MKDAILFLFGLMCILMGCRDDNDYTGPEVRLKSVLNEENKTIARYYYDADGRLSRLWMIPFPEFSDEKMELSFYYDSAGRLISKKGHMPGNPIMSSMLAFEHDVEYTYQYDSTELDWSVSIEHIYPNLPEYECAAITWFHYLSETCLESASGNGDESGSRTQWWFDETGNLTEIRNYYMSGQEEERLLHRTELEYDTSHNPYYSISDPETMSVNNVTKRTEINYNNTNPELVDYTSVTTFEYTYNRQQWPLTRVTVNPNETRKTEHFEYY